MLFIHNNTVELAVNFFWGVGIWLVKLFKMGFCART